MRSQNRNYALFCWQILEKQELFEFILSLENRKNMEKHLLHVNDKRGSPCHVIK